MLMTSGTVPPHGVSHEVGNVHGFIAFNVPRAITVEKQTKGHDNV